MTFDLSGIQDTELLNIQLYQVLSIISSYAVANGRRVSEYFRRGIIGGDKSQRPHSIITINGAHKLFNYRYSESLNFLKDLIENVSSNYSAFIMEMSSLDNILLNVKNLVFNHQLADNRSYGKYPYDEHVRYAFLP